MNGRAVDRWHVSQDAYFCLIRQHDVLAVELEGASESDPPALAKINELDRATLELASATQLHDAERLAVDLEAVLIHLSSQLRFIRWQEISREVCGAFILHEAVESTAHIPG